MFDSPPPPEEIKYIALGEHDTGTRVHGRVYYYNTPDYKHQPVKINPWADVAWPTLFTAETISVPDGYLYPPGAPNKETPPHPHATPPGKTRTEPPVLENVISEYVDVREVVANVTETHGGRVTENQARAAYHLDALRTPPHEVAARLDTTPHQVQALRDACIRTLAPDFDAGLNQLDISIPDTVKVLTNIHAKR